MDARPPTQASDRGIRRFNCHSPSRLPFPPAPPTSLRRVGCMAGQHFMSAAFCTANQSAATHTSQNDDHKFTRTQVEQYLEISSQSDQNSDWNFLNYRLWHRS